jgi:hypothetical protein
MGTPSTGLRGKGGDYGGTPFFDFCPQARSRFSSINYRIHRKNSGQGIFVTNSSCVLGVRTDFFKLLLDVTKPKWQKGGLP